MQKNFGLLIILTLICAMFTVLMSPVNWSTETKIICIMIEALSVYIVIKDSLKEK